MALDRTYVPMDGRWAVNLYQQIPHKAVIKTNQTPTDTQASYLEADVLNDSFNGWQGAFIANEASK